MVIAKEILVYVKTTETCNLNCAHCFTSGSSGAKVFFNPTTTSQFLHDLVAQRGVTSVRLVYHGGEPMLAPISSLRTFHELTRHTLPNVSYSIQTNLVYPLTSEKLEFLDEVFLSGSMGTSWDPDIRFGSVAPAQAARQLALWEANVRALVARGHCLTMMVCLSRFVIENYEPADIIDYAIKLGFEYILFERLTSDGNAVVNCEIFPDNLKLDDWLLRMYCQTKEHRYHERIGNMFLSELATSLLHSQHVANRCRGCEQKLITINADGSLAGCPNSAAQNNWGHLDLGVDNFLQDRQRVGAICKELTRNSICLGCEVNDLCNGDCYKLKWDGEICSAPKSLMKFFKTSDEYAFNRELLLR